MTKDWWLVYAFLSTNLLITILCAVGIVSDHTAQALLLGGVVVALACLLVTALGDWLRS